MSILWSLSQRVWLKECLIQTGMIKNEVITYDGWWDKENQAKMLNKHTKGYRGKALFIEVGS